MYRNSVGRSIKARKVVKSLNSVCKISLLIAARFLSSSLHASLARLPKINVDKNCPMANLMF
jgi:hypothetical protein